MGGFLLPIIAFLIIALLTYCSPYMAPAVPISQLKA